MFTTLAVAVISASILARAEVIPSEPAPGESFNEGATCHVAWTGDTTANSPWKTTNIQLMTGSNINMVPLTTVTTVDGSTDGTYDWTCPSVTVNAQIFFYQFTSPNTANYTWTGRFTIASTTGSSTSPTETNTPGSTDGIQWGTAALSDPSTAVAPPSYLGGSSVASANASISSSATNSVVASTVPSTAASSASQSLAIPVVAPSAQSSGLSSASQSGSAAPSASSAANGAASLEVRFGQTLTALVGSAAAFILLL